MRLCINAVSECGPIREKNEDMISLGGELLRDGRISTTVEFSPKENYYLLVADGMGGHEGGARASRMALEGWKQSFELEEISASDFLQTATSSIRRISQKMNILSWEEQQVRYMGTTLTGIVWMADSVWLINSGDSRTYLMRDGCIQQISYDDEDSRGFLTNCIGAGVDTMLSVVDMTERIKEDDVILVCSDGLSDVSSDDYLEYFLLNSEHPAEDLMEWAIKQGSRDNISIIAARVGEGNFPMVDLDEDDNGRYDAWA
ncbi:MAG: serine/threonine-protein phosphatase [Alistipes sp.]|nr:serine/threonine-protein phosphatase [Candidatus Alistipes equi]